EAAHVDGVAAVLLVEQQRRDQEAAGHEEPIDDDRRSGQELGGDPGVVQDDLEHEDPAEAVEGRDVTQPGGVDPDQAGGVGHGAVQSTVVRAAVVRVVVAPGATVGPSSACSLMDAPRMCPGIRSPMSTTPEPSTRNPSTVPTSTGAVHGRGPTATGGCG